jgi:hypothetical protein
MSNQLISLVTGNHIMTKEDVSQTLHKMLAWFTCASPSVLLMSNQLISLIMGNTLGIAGPSAVSVTANTCSRQTAQMQLIEAYFGGVCVPRWRAPVKAAMRSVSCQHKFEMCYNMLQAVVPHLFPPGALDLQLCAAAGAVAAAAPRVDLVTKVEQRSGLQQHKHNKTLKKVTNLQNKIRHPGLTLSQKLKSAAVCTSTRSGSAKSRDSDMCSSRSFSYGGGGPFLCVQHLLHCGCNVCLLQPLIQHKHRKVLKKVT